MLRKTKMAYYENLDETKVSDNKRFWKKVKPSLSEKFNARERISLSENGEISLLKLNKVSQYSDMSNKIM